MDLLRGLANRAWVDRFVRTLSMARSEVEFVNLLAALLALARRFALFACGFWATTAVCKEKANTNPNINDLAIRISS
jgi:hypothetical protein